MEELNDVLMAIPSNIANMQLPDPTLRDYYLDEQNRVFWVDSTINENLLDLVKLIIKCNKEDNGLSTEERKPIKVYIDSPGGMCVAGFGIIDTMHNISAPVHTTCLGFAASMGAMILCQGDHRSALPHSEILIHQPLGGAQGQATDIQIHAENILKTKERLNRMLAKNTGQEYETICKDTERDNFMTADEAKEYGLIDEVKNNR